MLEAVDDLLTNNGSIDSLAVLAALGGRVSKGGQLLATCVKVGILRQWREYRTRITPGWIYCIFWPLTLPELQSRYIVVPSCCSVISVDVWMCSSRYLLERGILMACHFLSSIAGQPSRARAISVVLLIVTTCTTCKD